jgi:hypothetical protein
MPTFTGASSYMNPLGRVVGLNSRVSVDMGNLPTLPERMDEHLKQRLIWHLRDTCEGIIEAAKLSLFKPGDFPVHKHGVDTGLLRESLTYHLVETLLTSGVYYDLLSDEAPYWKWVEFGHWVVNAETPWFWPGYHYLENAIQTVGIRLLMRSVRAAWHDTVIVLAQEARAASPLTGHIGPSPMFGR